MAKNKVVYSGQTIIDLTDTTATAPDVAQGKYFYGADGVRTAGTASGGGGASNVVTGTFKGTTAGAAMDIDLPYTGNGYPVVVLIYPKAGPTTGDFNSLVQQYAIQQVSIVKSDMGSTPTYPVSGSGGQNGALIITRNKDKSTSATSYTQSGNSNNRPYANTNASSSQFLSVRIKSATKMSVFIASTSYGFAANIEYTYHVIYSS